MDRPSSIVAHADVLGAKVHMQADVSQMDTLALLGGFGVGVALLFCACGATCCAALYCMYSARSRQPRYTYTPVAMHPPGL